MAHKYPAYQFSDCAGMDTAGCDGDAVAASAPASDSEDLADEEEEEEVEQYLETEEQEDPSAREKLAAALPLPMQQTYRVLEHLMAPENHVHNWPFVNAVDPSGALWDYADVVTKPVWLKSVRDQLLHGKYQSPTAVFADLRLMLRNCYRYNGPQHSVTRRGLRLEELMEQRIAQLPPSLRDQCTLEATEGPDAVIDPKVVSRRRSNRGKAPGYFSHVLHAVRHARADREKEFRRQQLEQRRQQRQEKQQAIVAWETRLLQGATGDRLRTAWELPQLAQFIHLSLRALNIFEVPLYEMERMLLVPQSSETLAMMMTSLVSSPLIRTKLGEMPPMPYTMWTEKLAARVQLWYRAFSKEAGRTDRLLDTQGIEPAFWAVVGEQNPFDTKLFHQLSFYQRIWMVKTMCDYLFHHHKTVQDCVMETSVEEPREAVLGRDRHGFEYIHFPQLYVQDVRLYRRLPWQDDSGDSPDEGAPLSTAAQLAPPALRPAELGRWSRARLERFRRRLSQLRTEAVPSRGGRGRRRHTCLLSGSATPAASDDDSPVPADGDGTDDSSDSSLDDAEDGPEFTLTRSGRKSHRPPKKARALADTPRTGRRGRGRGGGSGASAKPVPAANSDPNVCRFCGMSVRTERARKAHRCLQEQQTDSARVPVPGSDSANEAETGSDSDSSRQSAATTPRGGRHRGRGGPSRQSVRTPAVSTPAPVEHNASRGRRGRPRGRPPKRPQGQGRGKSTPQAMIGGATELEPKESPRRSTISTRGSRASSRVAAKSREASPARDSERESRASSRAARKSREASPAADIEEGSGIVSRDASPSGSSASPPSLVPEGQAEDDVCSSSESAAAQAPPTLSAVKADNGDSVTRERPDGDSNTDHEEFGPAVNGDTCEGGDGDGPMRGNSEPESVPVDALEPPQSSADSPRCQTNGEVAADCAPAAVEDEAWGKRADGNVKTREVEKPKQMCIETTVEASGPVSESSKTIVESSGTLLNGAHVETLDKKGLIGNLKSESDGDCEKMDTEDSEGSRTENKTDLKTEVTDTKLKSELPDIKPPFSLCSEQKPVLKSEPCGPSPSAEVQPGADSDVSSDAGGDDDGVCTVLNVPELVVDPEHVTPPDAERFQLVADTFDGLRRLIDTFDPEGEKKRPPCEVELHSALLKILRELEPLESKINQSVRRMRKRLCQEWLNYIERPSDYRDPNEEAWREPDDESDPTPKPVEKSPEPSPEPSGDEEVLDAEGRRKQRSRRAKRKRVNYCVDGVPGERTDSKDKDQDAWQVSSRGRMRKVRKMDDFAYEAESGDDNSRSSVASAVRDAIDMDVCENRAKRDGASIWEEYRQQLLKRESAVAARQSPARPARITEPSPIWNSELSILNKNIGDRVSRIRSELKSRLSGRRTVAGVAGGTASVTPAALGSIRRTVVGAPARPIGQKIVVSRANLVAGALTKVVHTTGEASPLVLKMTKDGKVFMAKAGESEPSRDGGATSASLGSPTVADPPLSTSSGHIASSSSGAARQAGRVSVVVPYKDPATGATMYMQLPPEQSSSILASLQLPGTSATAAAVAGPASSVPAAVVVSSVQAAVQSQTPIVQSQAQTVIQPQAQTVEQPQAQALVQPQAQPVIQSQAPVVQSQAPTMVQSVVVQPQAQSAAPCVQRVAEPYVGNPSGPQPGSVLLRHVQSLPIPPGGSGQKPAGPPAVVPAQPVHLGSVVMQSNVASTVKNVLQQAQSHEPLSQQQAQRLAQRVMCDIKSGASSTAATSPGKVVPAQQQPAAVETSPRRLQLIRPMPAAVRLGTTALPPAGPRTAERRLQLSGVSPTRPTLLAASSQMVVTSSPSHSLLTSPTQTGTRSSPQQQSRTIMTPQTVSGLLPMRSELRGLALQSHPTPGIRTEPSVSHQSFSSVPTTTGTRPSPPTTRSPPKPEHQTLVTPSGSQPQLRPLASAGVILTGPRMPLPSAGSAAVGRPTVLTGGAAVSPQKFLATVPAVSSPGVTPPRGLPTLQLCGVVRPPPMQRAPRYLSTSVQFVSSAPTPATAAAVVGGPAARPEGPQQGKIVVIKNGSEQKLGVLMPDGQIMALSDKQVNSVKLGALKQSRPPTGPGAAPS